MFLKHLRNLNGLISNYFMFCSHSITLALQTAARLSQQADLGGILEEIEVNSLTPPEGAVSLLFDSQTGF